MSLSEKVKMEAMSETMSLIIQNGECMTELESIQIMKKLLEIIGEMYESGKLLSLIPHEKNQAFLSFLFPFTFHA